MGKSFVHYLSVLGTQRVLLALLSVMVLILTIFADVSLEPVGWGLILGVVVPAISPILFMVYGLDLMMSCLWRNEYGDSGRRRYHFIMYFNLVLMGLLLAFWLPVFLSSQ